MLSIYSGVGLFPHLLSPSPPTAKSSLVGVPRSLDGFRLAKQGMNLTETKLMILFTIFNEFYEIICSANYRANRDDQPYTMSNPIPELLSEPVSL